MPWNVACADCDISSLALLKQLLCVGWLSMNLVTVVGGLLDIRIATWKQLCAAGAKDLAIRKVLYNVNLVRIGVPLLYSSC
eukprot:1804224-Amphidinium_carterae.1